jgi:hypothetical protein
MIDVALGVHAILGKASERVAGNRRRAVGPVDVRSYQVEAVKGSVRSCELNGALQGCAALSTAGEI